MRNMHKYEELLPQEFEAELQKNPVIYCAFGPMEYHGIQNALGIDPVKAYEICLRAAVISGGIVFPMVPIAPQQSLPSWKFMEREDIRREKNFPDTMTSISLCRQLYYELFEHFAENLGFKVCVAFGGHGPAGTLIGQIAEEHQNNIKGMKLLAASSLSHNRDLVEAYYEEIGVERIGHGGLWETAMNMGCKDEYVDITVFDRPCSETFTPYPEKFNPMPKPTGEQKKSWTKEDWSKYYNSLSPSIEEMKKVTHEFGEKLLQTSAERIAAEVNKLLGR